jgi:hypothetical protein
VVAETNVDVIIVRDFLKFIGNIVGDEDESKLIVFEGCGRHKIGKFNKAVGVKIWTGGTND